MKTNTHNLKSTHSIKQKGNAELLFVLPILIICLWGFAFISAIILEKENVHQHLWQASISHWNGHSLNQYTKANDLKKDTLEFHTKKNFTWAMSLLKDIPIAFKLFQTNYTMQKITASTKSSNYSELSHLNQWVNNKSLKRLDLKSKLLFPNPGRRKKSSKKLLKHGLWLQGMCDAEFNELFLPILGTELLLEVSMGIKLPFNIGNTQSIPFLRCNP